MSSQGSPIVVSATDSSGQDVAVALSADSAVEQGAFQAMVPEKSAHYEDGTLQATGAAVDLSSPQLAFSSLLLT